ncbi:hypothetical protein CAEBREN_32578 [Caenorhabditis brenneri]|uniref:Protein kinase domain-containing protein n=1 Tax=Caenorhabditis brenneri TaxID=135651 RepID=G0MG10_CAEBE|nr:hypothetical protein CAEBREN_32578 [Caenorhabditis brenneri]
MDPPSKLMAQSMPPTPKLAKTEKEKASGPEDPKAKADKKTEDARQQNKKAQDRDLPRFGGKDVKNQESEITTAKDTYELVTELGQGSFGAVYGVIRQSDKKGFALKCESVNMKRSMLPHEANVLLALNLLKSPHFVEMVDHGTVRGRFLFVVIKLVGKNLWDVRVSLEEKKFSLTTALLIAEQTLAGLRDLHRVGWLHRDLKPPNFCIGREGDESFHTVFILDFGLCRKVAMKGKDIRVPRKECAFRGTTRYASIAAHDGKEQSRKDDVEAWWYMVAEMMVIDLPWKAIRGTERETVRSMKWRLREDEEFMKFLFRKCCYEQMNTILLYLDSLNYHSIPDYDFVYRHIKCATIVYKCDLTECPDWDPKGRDEKKKYRGPVYQEGEPYIVKELE